MKNDSETQLVLFVGEGDFSYAANYVENQMNAENEIIMATCLSSGDLTSKQNINTGFIELNGGLILTDVDATKLQHHPVLCKLKFTKVIFNFPHVPIKMNIGQNRILVESFLKSAEQVLDKNGRIHVTLCRGQGGTQAENNVREWCNSWQVVELASRSGLMLCDISPFGAGNFKRYECTGFRGQSKSFHLEDAVTHVFSRGEQVLAADYMTQTISKDDLEDWLFFYSNNQYRSLSHKLDSPLTIMLCALKDIVKSSFPSSNFIFIESLLKCSDFVGVNETSKYTLNLPEATMCEKCLYLQLSMFISKRKSSSMITSMSSSVFCFKNFDLNDSQLQHIISFFSASEDALMNILKTVFTTLKQSNCIKDYPKISSWCNIKDLFDSVFENEQQIYTVGGITIEELIPITVNYAIEKDNCYIVYTNVDFNINCTNTFKKNCLQLGYIVKISYKLEPYFAVFLNVKVLCKLKFHVVDDRIFLLKNSFFSNVLIKNEPSSVYRSPSLFPASHSHDTSFWVEGDFEERKLFLLVRKVMGLLVKSVTLVDTYCDERTQRESRCYRFVYQSHGKVVSKSVVSSIHSQLRKTIESSLSVCLR